MTFPLPTLAPTIDANGITAPPFSDIFASLQASYRAIYGADADLDADTQDGQWLAVIASAINDTNAAAIAVYNAFSPATAQGVGLSSVVKINGIARHVSSKSTVDVAIGGTAGTLIVAGIVADTFGNQWALPPNVTIPGGGTITVTATATVAGAISAAPATVTQIVNPTRGWQSVNNVASAHPGEPVETDAELRIRQSSSTANPAQAIGNGIVGAVLDVPAVTACVLYENSTNSTDANGVPAHSICVVVDGGDNVAIATAILNRKTPGTGTYGNTTVNVLDPGGQVVPIKFDRPTAVRITAQIDITALAGYVGTTGDAIKAFVAAYVSALAIGNDVYLTKVSAAALLDNGQFSDTYNLTAVRLARYPAGPTAADVVIAFDEHAELVVGDITLTVT